VFALDAKLDIDDNAQFRQQGIVEMLKEDLEKSVEHQARLKGLSYIKMEGNIGCVVNGAGLAMATMDLVKLFGGTPANFLDIGGSSNPGKVKTAMELLKADKSVRVALFNIFGGITRCDDVAIGIIAALKDVGMPFPIIVRLTGTNEEAAKCILKDSPLIFAETMVEAAKKAVEACK
jgi:succinyl-CoA synthetase beta subunit